MHAMAIMIRELGHPVAASSMLKRGDLYELKSFAMALGNSVLHAPMGRTSSVVEQGDLEVLPTHHFF